MQPSNICYIEIPTPNLKKAGEFYSETFGWKVEPGPIPDYWMFSTGEGGLSGGLDPNLPVRNDGGVLFYLQVEDIPQAIERVCHAGGQEIQKKTPIADGQYGYLAIFKDPNDNRIGLWSKQ